MSTDPQFYSFLATQGTQNAIGICYHCWWPGSGDPYYNYNIPENTARINYYGVIGTPTVKCDGGTSGTGGALTTSYNQRNAIASPVEIGMDISVGTSIDVVAHVTAESYFTGTNLKLHTVLLGINFDTTGGGWAQSNYQYVMLDMAPSSSGQVFSIGPSETVDMEASLTDPIFTSMTNLAVVCFVQNDGTREIHNSKYMTIPMDLPRLTMADYEVMDDVNGVPNGIPEPGETCELTVELQNSRPFATAVDVTAVLSTGDPGITITDDSADFPDIDPEAAGDNSDNPFVFEVSDTFEAHYVVFELTKYANDNYSTTESITFMVGIPQILLVDDDGGGDFEEAYISDLESMDLAVNTWEVTGQGSPSGDYLLNYELVIWHTGMELDPLDQDEQDAIAAYLDAGSKLFMSSENLGDALGDSSFYQDYFHATHEIDHILTTSMNGVEGHPISDSTSLLLLGGEYWPDSQSAIIPDGEAEAVYNYTNLAASTGVISYAGSYALLYFAAPYECIAPNPTSSTPRAEVMSNIISWFNEFEVSVDPDMELAAVNYLLCEVYPNPFNPSATISFSLPQSGMVTAAVFNVNGARVAEVYSGQMKAGQHTFEFDGSELSSGIYFLNIESPSGLTVQKMVLMK